MRTYSLALFIITLTVVALTADTQVTSKYASIRDAVLDIHPCLDENAELKPIHLIKINGIFRISHPFGPSGTCEAAVSIECVFDKTDRLYSCHLLDNHEFDLSFGAKFGPHADLLDDAPVRSQTPTALQLIQDEMRAPVTEE